MSALEELIRLRMELAEAKSRNSQITEANLAIIDGVAARLRNGQAGGDQLRAEGAERCAQEIRRLLTVEEKDKA